MNSATEKKTMTRRPGIEVVEEDYGWTFKCTVCGAETQSNSLTYLAVEAVFKHAHTKCGSLKSFKELGD